MYISFIFTPGMRTWFSYWYLAMKENGCVSVRKCKIGFLNSKEFGNGFCVSLPDRLIQNLSDHDASKIPKNPLWKVQSWIFRNALILYPSLVSWHVLFSGSHNSFGKKPNDSKSHFRESHVPESTRYPVHAFHGPRVTQSTRCPIHASFRGS